MARTARLLLALMVVAGLLTTAPAAADPSDNPEEHSHGETHSGPPELPPHSGGEENLTLVGNSDKDGTTNSDMAFWQNLAFSGNYNGFRILDISRPSNPRVLSDYFCRGPQNDVSVYKLRNRLLLFQSIDRAQTKASCDGTPAGSSQDTPISSGMARFGFEGIRVFDVTNPRAPRFLTGVPTSCGSHTHTLVPDLRRQRVLLYVSSYPLGSGITPAQDVSVAGPLACQSPHQKISIVTVPARNPAGARLLREEPLSSDSRPYPGAQPGNPLAPPFIACHDITVLMQAKIALGACAGDAQIWDISNPANPTASDGERHTHIARPAQGGYPFAQGAADNWEFVHNVAATYDGKFMAFADETGGGGTPECDVSAEEYGGQSENGFYYFYPLVEPGEPAPPLLSRYMIPRPQGTQICVMHNGNIIPTNQGYYLVSAEYQGGDTVVNFTDPTRPVEVAYADRSDAIGAADSWSTYWYNDFVYANTGLGRLGPNGNRCFDVSVLHLDGERVRGRTFPHLNPQTIDAFMTNEAGGNN